MRRNPVPRFPNCLGFAAKQLRPLSPDAELFDQTAIAGNIARMEVVEQASPLADNPQQSDTRVMVLLVRRQMLGQLVDTPREQRDLNFRRAAIVRSARVGLSYFPFTGDREGHSEFFIFPSFP